MSADATGGVTEHDPVDALTRVLVRACRALADAGRPSDAGRLAADAWKVLRHDHVRQAQHLDGAMHHIARVEQRLESESQPIRPDSSGPSRKATTVSEDRVLDVRTEIPKRRHELIFETFDQTQVGTGYVLVNDHDPKPLYYQLQAEHNGEFSWEYLESGPEVWRVRIGRVAAPAAQSS
ncbi:MAG TPA: DUF2249 domain-containing protein [Jatrophihabitantaceae bacterium]|nr:DUF2249 domain-containing protein [Jatrophihabitantaceae bacterium]